MGRLNKAYNSVVTNLNRANPKAAAPPFHPAVLILVEKDGQAVWEFDRWLTDGTTRVSGRTLALELGLPFNHELYTGQHWKEPSAWSEAQREL
jgi:hypothetical protein